jgi:hypothetical protein
MGSQWFEELAVDQHKPRLVRTEREGDDLVLWHRWGRLPSSPPEIGLLFLFWTEWAAACLFVIRHVTDLAIRNLVLFAVPVVAAWAITFCFVGAWRLMFRFLRGIFFGCSEFRIGPDGLTLTRMILFLRWKRRVPLAEITGIAEYRVQVANDEGRGSHIETGLMIVTTGKPVRFAQGVDTAEISFLIDLLESHLDLDNLGESSNRSHAKASSRPAPVPERGDPTLWDRELDS